MDLVGDDLQKDALEQNDALVVKSGEETTLVARVVVVKNKNESFRDAELAAQLGLDKAILPYTFEFRLEIDPPLVQVHRLIVDADDVCNHKLDVADVGP